jgi:hypothetical protein
MSLAVLIGLGNPFPGGGSKTGRGRGTIQRQARTSVAAKSSPLNSKGAFSARSSRALPCWATTTATAFCSGLDGELHWLIVGVLRHQFSA